MEELWFANKDISTDILSRLPTKALLSLKCVSKEWQSLISERSFIRQQLKRTEPVSGFLFQERFQWCDDDIRLINYIPLQMKKAELQRSVFDFLPEDVVLSGVTNGLICCRSCFPSPHPAIYICNPLNREWLTVPWPKPDKRSTLALVFDPFKNPIDESTHFKVVRVDQTEIVLQSKAEIKSSYLTFEIYSSNTGTWKRSPEICLCNYSVYKNKGIFIGEAIYWLTDGPQILMLDVERELSWLVRVPFSLTQYDSVPEMCIGESEGKLNYVLVSEGGVEVWALEDFFECNWVPKYSVSLDEMEEENPEFICNLQNRVAGRLNTDIAPWMEPLAFKDGLLFLRIAANTYIYNTATRKLDSVCPLAVLGSNSMFYPIVLPYCMSLVPVSRE